MKKVTILLAFLGLLGMQALYAQKEISGTITSAEDGEVLPGVSVVVKGTTIGTITDFNGIYTLTVPDDAEILVFSFVGMETQEIAIGETTSIDLAMVTNAVGLDEVVVTAFGITKQKKALSYSTETIKDDQLTQAAQPSVANALQGKIAGITVKQSSGLPGSSSYMLIRGAASLDQNNQPMFIIDGMPIESGAIFTDDITENRVSASDAASRSLDINPEDIENIEVLKGATAAAIYGLRASNGVILITTKSGKNNKPGEPKITFSTSYTADLVTRNPELQSKYAQGTGGDFSQSTSMSWGPPIDSLGRYYNQNLGDTVEGKRYDNVTPFFQTGTTYTADLSISKGDEFGNYSASIGYLDQTGVIPTTGMKRYTGKINGEIKLNKKMTIEGSALYTHMDVDKIANGSNLSNPLFTVWYAPRSYDLWGTPYEDEDDPYTQIHYRGAMDNPRWSLAHNSFNELNDRIIAHTRFEWKLLEPLKLRYQIGVDYISNQQKEVYEMGSGETGGRSDPPGGKITDQSYVQREVNSNAMLVFNKAFGGINLNVVAGNEFYQQYSRELEVIGTGFNLGGYHNLDNTESQDPYEYFANRRTVGFYGSAQADYKSIVYLTATGRNDIVSYLVAGNRSYFYPSVGASFVFTELFEIPESILSFGKIRASWAEVGQQVDIAYPTQNIYVSGGATCGFLTDGIDAPLGGINAFSNYWVLRNPDLKPQTSKTTEIGFDLRFLNGRVTVDYAHYITMLEDQIFEVPIAPSSGYESELRNAGTMKSIGNEIIMGITPVRTNDFTWNMSMNYTQYTNTVEELAEGVSNIYLGGFTTPSIRALKGETYPSIYGIGYLRDENGRIVVLDDNESAYHGMPLADEVSKKVGDVQPDFFIGFTNMFTYKGITLTAQVDWQQGGMMYSGNNMLGRLYGALKITEDRGTKVILDAVKGYIDASTGELVVTGENDIAILRGEEYWGDVLQNIDEAHVYETSYVRFRELSLGYAVPSKLLNNIFIDAMNLSVVGRNLALWSTYPNFDPETSTTGAVNGQGLEYVAFPQTSSFGGKISITF